MVKLERLEHQPARIGIHRLNMQFLMDPLFAAMFNHAVIPIGYKVNKILSGNKRAIADVIAVSDLFDEIAVGEALPRYDIAYGQTKAGFVMITEAKRIMTTEEREAREEVGGE